LRRKLRAFPAPVTYTGAAAVAKLVELGLSVEIITQAVIYGQMERDACSVLDPPTFPGTTAWATTNRALRALLRRTGWKLSNTANFCTTISPDGEVAIMVSTGDDGTGKEHAVSNFKNRRGPRTREAVENNEQLLLFEVIPDDTLPIVPSKTWILLIARKGDQVFCEMKLPRSMDEGGRVEAWAERIIIPTINLNDAPKTSRLPIEPEGGANEIDIDVKRRASR
jgi:hypothetical protein